MAILLYRIDTSRLTLTALDNKVDIIDIINIFVVCFLDIKQDHLMVLLLLITNKQPEKRIELSSLTYEIKVLTIKLFKLYNK